MGKIKRNSSTSKAWIGWVLGGVVLVVALGAPRHQTPLKGLNNPSRSGGSSPVSSLRTWVEEFRQWTQSGLSEESCIQSLSQYYQDLLKLTPDSQVAREIEQRPGQANRAFFEARQDLREGLFRLYQKGAYSEACADQARNVMRVLRYTEEYIAEHGLKVPPYNEKKPYPYLAGDRPYLHLARELSSFSPKDLKSGDILLSRGNAFASAAIARLSQVDGQFSHGAFIYIDPATRQPLVLEAHIEVGSTIRSYEEYASDGNARVMLLRFRGEEGQALAARAAQEAYERLKAAERSPFKVVPYDFAMDLSDENAFFCTEIPYFGFKKASAGRVQVPLYLGRIEPKNRNFVNRLGISTQRSFLPSDLDVDPRFKVLAEWKDISRVGWIRRKDAVLDRFYAWSDEYGYQLHGTVSSWFRKTVVWKLRRWPLFSHLLQSKFPLNMPQSVLESITVLNALGEVLEGYLETRDDLALKQRGFRLTISEMESQLDAFRLEDLQRYEASRGNKKQDSTPVYFHHVFRAGP
ncbi:MAG: hypothetical protein KGQ59_06980 [Bdellovibrionales bacterium]|nr:hypothetical protein [Bdellovibrionales bacterium]